jgi:hypothetical protein
MNVEDEAKKRRKALMLRGVQDQLKSPETPEVRLQYVRLRSLGHSDTEARELIATVLAFYLWHLARGDAYGYTDYVTELQRLPEIDWQRGADDEEQSEER